MKKMIAMLCMAALCAGAAEVEKFSLKYLKSSRASKLQAKGMTSVKGVIPFEKQLVFSLKYPEMPVGTWHRFSFKIKKDEMERVKVIFTNSAEKIYVVRYVYVPAGESTFTLYFQQYEAKQFDYISVESKSPGQIQDLKLEKLDEKDFKENLFPAPATQITNWNIVWGKAEMFKTVEDKDCPFDGPVLFTTLKEVKPGIGLLATQALPYVPDRKFRIEMWVRSEKSGIAKFIIRGKKGDNQVKNIPLQKEWKKVVIDGQTSGALGIREDFHFIFAATKDEIPFYISNFSIKYL